MWDQSITSIYAMPFSLGNSALICILNIGSRFFPMISSQALPCDHHHVCAIEGLRLSAKAGGWRCAASDRPTLTFPRLPNFLTTNLNRSQCAQPNHQQDDFIFDALFELSVRIETRFLLLGQVDKSTVFIAKMYGFFCALALAKVMF